MRFTVKFTIKSIKNRLCFAFFTVFIFTIFYSNCLCADADPAAIPTADLPLITSPKIIKARFNLIKRLIGAYKYREALNELKDLRIEVPRTTGLFIDFWTGITYMHIGNSLKDGLMSINKADELVYREEVDIVYHTEEEKELIKKTLKTKGSYYTRLEVAELERAVTKSKDSVSGSAATVKKEESLEDDDLESDDLETADTQKSAGVSDLEGPLDSLDDTDLKGEGKKPGNETKDALSRAVTFYESAIIYFNKLIGVSVNNPYREDAVIRKAEVFNLMGEPVLAVEQYNFFIKFFPQSGQIVSVLIDKANLLTEMKYYEQALAVFSEILDTYPETEKKNYVKLKIEYLRLLMQKGASSRSDTANQYFELQKKIDLLEGFEKEIRKKEIRLKELESYIK